MKARLSFDEDGSLDTETCESCATLRKENYELTEAWRRRADRASRPQLKLWLKYAESRLAQE